VKNKNYNFFLVKFIPFWYLILTPQKSIFGN
jgi:hypothetical protein